MLKRHPKEPISPPGQTRRINLFSAARDSVGWSYRIIRQLFCVAPGVTSRFVIAAFVSRIARMAAFLLPLKVILLAGSEGVPSYFQAFVSPGEKNLWIAALALLAVALYGLTVLLESRSEKLARKGGMAVVANANSMSMVGNQAAQTEDYYARFAQLVADSFFVSVGLGLLAFFNHWLSLYVIGSILVFFLVSTWGIRGWNLATPTRFARFMKENLGSYLGMLSSVLFLSSFIVILLPFLLGVEANILLAMISFALLRRMTSSLSSVTRDVVSLSGQKPLIGALLLADKQFHLVVPTERQSLGDLFSPANRLRVVQTQLAGVVPPISDLNVNWLDPITSGLDQFEIAVKQADGAVRHLRLRAATAKNAHQFDNEQLLFQHVARKRLWAPERLAAFMYGPYSCDILDAGAVERVRPEDWRQCQRSFLRATWSYQPSDSLVGIYGSSHPTLHERLDRNLISRLEIAADAPAEIKMLDNLQRHRVQIVTVLRQLPMILVNPDFGRGGLLALGHGRYTVVNWGRWTIGPLGSGELSGFSEADLRELLDLARQSRADIPNSISVEHINFVRDCLRFENLVQRGFYKGALRMSPKLVGFAALENALV